jgi:hypothetical protein
VRVALVAVLVAACGGARWHRVSQAPGAVYRYDAPIEAYAPDDPGLWLVTAADPTPAGRQRVAGLVDNPDDVLRDGFVAWATNERAAALRERPEVAAVVPLQPADRAGALGDAGGGAVSVRIELAGGATVGQRDAVIAWLARRGAGARAIGRATIDAELAVDVAREAAALGPVRWIERRAR